jgi:hypothetical protein
MPVVAPIVMRMNRTWDVTCPPVKKHVIAGQLVPTVKGTLAMAGGGRLLRRKRRLAIEIHGPDVDDNTNKNKEYTTTKRNSTITSATKQKGRRRSSFRAPGRGLVRSSIDSSNNNSSNTSTKGSRTIIDLSKELKDDDRLVIRILKPRRYWGFSRDTDDSSSSEDAIESELLTDNNNNSSSLEIDDGWVEYRKYGLEEIDDTEIHTNSSSWEATLGLGPSRERREIRFESTAHGTYICCLIFVALFETC